MAMHTKASLFAGAEIPQSGVEAAGPVARDRAPVPALRSDSEQRQLDRMVQAGFLVLLVPAALGRATGWRWRPWPPGPEGYGSVVSEARNAAAAYVPCAFQTL